MTVPALLRCYEIMYGAERCSTQDELGFIKVAPLKPDGQSPVRPVLAAVDDGNHAGIIDVATFGAESEAVRSCPRPTG